MPAIYLATRLHIAGLTLLHRVGLTIAARPCFPLGQLGPALRPNHDQGCCSRPTASGSACGPQSHGSAEVRACVCVCVSVCVCV